MADVDPGDGDPGDPGDPTDTPIARKCSTTDAALELCVDFEDGNGASLIPTDGSGKNRVITLAQDIDFMQRGTSPNVELAGQLSSASRLQVAETAALDITQNLTLSMWMKVGTASANAYWLLDNNTQYHVSFQPDGQVRCGLGSEVVSSGALRIYDQDWHHIGCTYEGAQLKLFVDGSRVGCRSLETMIATGGSVGTSIGANISAGPTFSDQFIGGLDNVQVFSRTLTDQQICEAAGHTSCGNYCGFSVDL